MEIMKIVKKVSVVAGFAVLSTMGADNAEAATVGGTSTLTVSAYVDASCAFGAVTNLDFGAYDDLANSDATAAFDTSCSAGVPYTVDVGTGGSGNKTGRTLTGTGGTLNYGMFTDAGRTVNADVISVPLGGAVTTTLYGRIPSGQAAAGPGSYSDSVTLTIYY
jgi:spore coat protein U-like protein